MKRFGVSVAALVLAAGVPFAATAALIVPVSQSYSVSAMVDPHPLGDPISNSLSASTPGPLGAGAYAEHPTDPGFFTTASMTQTSKLTESAIEITWSGANYTHFYGGQMGSEGYVDVLFDLTVPSRYFYVDIFQASSGSLTANFRDSLGGVIGAGDGELPAGRYRLTVDVDGPYFASNFPEGQFLHRVVLSFTPIPEPGTALLVALGLGALAARRQRAALR